MNELTIHVKNIKCDGCVQTIKNNLQGVGGVVTADASKENQTVTVTGTDLKQNVIIKKLLEIGYPATDN
ncbi:heavy-metal-associated domain-containing protein [Panacibacter ginsenosidivorans]|uniref:Heavy-metal-associated domain-containing protein n=1 Tax=Panacibacter ginsenosidivorans TaxID=1813871 RepID=A0A5B8VFJ6_9BACT|nr:heavy-metal-associated domain-containing protein [Panacibacter ginsenosidivorans]QEC69875.1 heavy-metal-associated domain-containing protein [Panacibacter ginsenosidivorans]